MTLDFVCFFFVFFTTKSIQVSSGIFKELRNKLIVFIELLKN